MSNWDYRILINQEGTPHEFWEVVEVYYNDDEKPCGYCEATAGGTTLAELQKSLDDLHSALSKPFLTPDDVGDWAEYPRAPLEDNDND